MLRFLFINAIVNQPSVKGDYGEMVVKSIFQLKRFSKPAFYNINDIYFGDEDNSQQVDHIVISTKGIFVIETKYIHGRIIGYEDSYQWTIYNKKKEYKMYNPLKQNANHVKVVSEFLNCEYPINSLIVFASNNKPIIDAPNVINFTELKNYLFKYGSDISISDEEKEHLYNLLMEHKKNNKISKNAHINNIKKSE